MHRDGPQCVDYARRDKPLSIWLSFLNPFETFDLPFVDSDANERVSERAFIAIKRSIGEPHTAVVYVGHEISVAILEACGNDALGNIRSGPVVNRDHSLVGVLELGMDAVDFPANLLFRPAAGLARSKQALHSNLQTEIAFASVASKLVAAAASGCGS